MDIAKCASEGDAALEQNGLKLFLEPGARNMLHNTTIDYKDGHGFVLTGMQSSCGSCSC
ncbi:MAG: hypothetical protein ACM34I_00985 [bacterium]